MTKTEWYARNSGWNVLAILVLFFVGLGYYRLKEYRFSLRVIWYTVEYGAKPNDIYIQPKPQDCDWEEAPKGNKGCHFERELVVYDLTRRGNDSSIRVSEDRGQTWRKLAANESPRPQVVMSWNKIQE
jgi:hypothetical protein